ncbi:MAG: DUF5134 domain-containing protein [Acidimicrobiales bacterium]
MPYPSWLGYAFAAVMMVVGTYCLSRLVRSTRTGWTAHDDVQAGHVLMAFAMVGMLVPDWNVLPVPLWEVVFGVMALWFLAMAGTAVARHGVATLASGAGSHARHYLVHAVMACAMLDMYWLGMPMTGSPGVGGMAGGMGGMATSGASGGGDPSLTAFLIVVMLVSAVWQLDTVEPAMPVRRAAVAVVTGNGGGRGDTLPAEPADSRWLATGPEVGCHVTMCVTMAFMLVLML